MGVLALMVRLLQTQLSPGPRGAYRESLGKLELQYAKLLVRAGGTGRSPGGICWGREASGVVGGWT